MKQMMRLTFMVAIVAAGFISLNAHPAVGQDIRTGSNREGQPGREDILLMRSAGREISGRDRALVAVQIREDFNEIQVMNNLLAEKIESDDPLEPKSVADVTSKLRKRAERLMDNLNLPQSNRQVGYKAEAVTNAEELKRSLNSLVTLVVELTRNPIFGFPRSTKTDSMRQARHDLEDIISLSKYLRKKSLALQ